MRSPLSVLAACIAVSVASAQFAAAQAPVAPKPGPEHEQEVRVLDRQVARPGADRPLAAAEVRVVRRN